MYFFVDFETGVVLTNKEESVCILLVILRIQIVDGAMVIWCSEMHVFPQGCFLLVFWERRGEQRGQREIQGAQNSGNPNAK